MRNLLGWLRLGCLEIRDLTLSYDQDVSNYLYQIAFYLYQIALSLFIVFFTSFIVLFLFLSLPYV